MEAADTTLTDIYGVDPIVAGLLIGYITAGVVAVDRRAMSREIGSRPDDAVYDE